MSATAASDTASFAARRAREGETGRHATRSSAATTRCCGTCDQTSSTDAPIRLEQAVFGSDYGADGWATVEQVDDVACRLGLEPGRRLLDIGTGRGWPGLYLAKTTGCAATLTDQTDEGLCGALARAHRDGVTESILTVASTAQALPFRSSSFDAIVHTDVLCCLRPKLRALCETRRLLRPGGHTAFFVIHLATQLSPEQRQTAVDAGPPEVVTRSRNYVSLLNSAGFVDVDQIDVTATFALTHRAWLRHAHRLANQLAAAEPPGAFVQRVNKHTAAADAINQGLLRRSLFIARRPPAQRSAP